MLALTYSLPMLKRYCELNNFMGAFVWHDEDGFNIYLGDPSSAIGIKEAGPFKKREAIELRDKINARIKLIESENI